MKKVMIGKHSSSKKLYCWDVPTRLDVPIDVSGKYAIVENGLSYSLVRVIAVFEFNELIDEFKYLDTNNKWVREFVSEEKVKEWHRYTCETAYFVK